MEYTDFHRRILQVFTREYVVNEARLQQEYVQYCREKGTPQNGESLATLEKISLEINDKLTAYNFGLRIKKRQMVELDGRIYHVLVNIRADKISEVGSMHKEWVIHWFKEVCKALCKQKDGTISALEAMQLANKLGYKLRGKEIEDKLRELCLEKWLYETERNGVYTAGMRTLVELKDLLAQSGALECPISSNYVITTRRYHQWAKTLGSHSEGESESNIAHNDENVLNGNIL